MPGTRSGGRRGRRPLWLSPWPGARLSGTHGLGPGNPLVALRPLIAAMLPSAPTGAEASPLPALPPPCPQLPAGPPSPAPSASHPLPSLRDSHPAQVDGSGLPLGRSLGSLGPRDTPLGCGLSLLQKGLSSRGSPWEHVAGCGAEEGTAPGAVAGSFLGGWVPGARPAGPVGACRALRPCPPFQCLAAAGAPPVRLHHVRDAALHWGGGTGRALRPGPLKGALGQSPGGSSAGWFSASGGGASQAACPPQTRVSGGLPAGSSVSFFTQPAPVCPRQGARLPWASSAPLLDWLPQTGAGGLWSDPTTCLPLTRPPAQTGTPPHVPHVQLWALPSAPGRPASSPSLLPSPRQLAAVWTGLPPVTSPLVRALAPRTFVVPRVFSPGWDHCPRGWCCPASPSWECGRRLASAVLHWGMATFRGLGLCRP